MGEDEVTGAVDGTRTRTRFPPNRLVCVRYFIRRTPNRPRLPVPPLPHKLNYNMIDCSIIMFTRAAPQAGDKPPRYIPRTSPLDSGLRRSDEMGWPE